MDFVHTDDQNCRTPYFSGTALQATAGQNEADTGYIQELYLWIGGEITIFNLVSKLLKN